MVAADPLAPVVTRLTSVSPAPAYSITCAGSPACAAGRTNKSRDILVELQRPDGRGVAELQVVPRPSRADALIVKNLIVADDPAVDLLDAGSAQRRRPLVENGRGSFVTSC